MRLVIGFLLALALAGCDRQKAEAPQGGAPSETAAATAQPAKIQTGVLDRSHAGTPAPDIAFESPTGAPTRFADFRGKPLLVNMWATWCTPCVAEMPTLDALAGQQSGVQVLALSQDSDGRDKVAAFFAKRQFARLQPYLDPDLDTMMALRLDTLPTTILYDKDGKEVWRMTGMVEWTGERAAKLLKEAGA